MADVSLFLFLHITKLQGKYMRRFMSLTFFFLLISPQVHACQGDNASFFFKSIPDPQPDANLIAIVSVSDKTDDRGAGTQTTMATVIQVMKSSDARVKQGDTIPMKYQSTSCGPDPLIGSKGTIIAKTGTDSKGHLVLHPYTHRVRDRRIEPPVILPDGYNSRPRPLQIGEDVPENFAVIMMGVVGTESLDFLQLDHSVGRGTGMSPTFLAPPKGIVAIAIPIGIKQLSISYVTTGRLRAGYRPNDTVQVNTPKLDINRPGLYYVATLDTNNPRQFQMHPLPEQMKQFRADYAGTVSGLEPINFKWPSQ